MDALLLMVLTFGGYILMYRLYGKYIGRKVFALSANAKTPSVELEDGVDYVPTKKEIIFGHHFTSISGTGPIVGPAIAVIWGWLPALLWVFLGSVIMGAVHDFGSLVISMRNQGKSVSDYTSKYISPRIRFMFFLIVFLELWIVIAIFGLVIAVIFKMYPGAVLPVWLEVVFAVMVGHMIYKKGKSVMTWSIIAVAAMYATVVLGAFVPINMPAIGSIPATGVWTIVLLVYAFIASVLPVTTLLQPRDFINSHQLIIAMGLLILGAVVAGVTGQMTIVAPAVQASPAQAPPMLPFLFITIACGAISGFHSLVSSGTTSKQVRNEDDSLFVGYGSMLMEGGLATLVIIAVAAGIGMGYTPKDGETLSGVAAWSTHYSSWAAAKGLGSKLSAFVVGSANMMSAIGLPVKMGMVIMSVFVASFAGTTLDTATRIQRYVLAEMFSSIKLNALTNKYVATAIAVGSAGFLAFATGAGGKGALTLWPLFGAINQTLASLVLIVIAVYLKQRGGMKWLVAGLPACFMFTMTLWALFKNQVGFINSGNNLLMVVNGIVIAIALWILVESAARLLNGRQTEPHSFSAVSESA